MKIYDLSIVIPSLREEFISNTVENICRNKRGATEVIVVLDGEWADPSIADHPDVRIVKLGQNVGQRAATNIGVKLSRAKYVAKTDAHCAFDEGFDVKLMEAMQDNWTIVPTMMNLHAFDWVCDHCEMRYYQGSRPDKCRSDTCQFEDQSFRKDTVFEPRTKERTGWNSPKSTAYRFTPDELQFKYFGALKGFQEKSGEEVAETMSLQGSFFMLTRDKYWELNVCDESWGGWGQQGTEVALKVWLSGGRVVCHRGTWYAHLFRTEDEFAFPWNVGLKESQGKQQRRSRQLCKDLFKNNAWDKQVRPLSWVVERFWDALQKETYQPEKGDRAWTQEDLAELKKTEGRFNKESKEPTKGILYFTDNELPLKYARPVQRIIRDIANSKKMELVSSTRKPMSDMGKNVVTNLPRGYECYFKQILAGLEAMTSDIVFMAEHDVLYPPEHFDFTPAEKDRAYYDINWWKVHLDDLYTVRWDAEQVSGLCAYREMLLAYYRERVATYDADNFDRKFEPYSGHASERWQASVPHIDLRTGRNLTYDKRSLEHFRNKDTARNFQVIDIKDIPGWKLEQFSDILQP